MSPTQIGLFSKDSACWSLLPIAEHRCYSVCYRCVCFPTISLSNINQNVCLGDDRLQLKSLSWPLPWRDGAHSLQHTATHCNTLQHTTTGQSWAVQRLMGPSWPLGERTEETLSFAKEHTFFRVASTKVREEMIYFFLIPKKIPSGNSIQRQLLTTGPSLVRWVEIKLHFRSSVDSIQFSSRSEPVFGLFPWRLMLNVRDETLHDKACVVKCGTPPAWTCRLCEVRHRDSLWFLGANSVVCRGWNGDTVVKQKW